MALTDDINEVSQTIFNLMEANKVALGFADVWDGDMEMIPRTPALCVVAGGKARELMGAPVNTDITFEVYLMIYHNKIQDVQVTYRETLSRAEAVEDVLHQVANQSLGGIILHGYVTASEPGYSNVGTTKMRSTRLTWRGLSRKQLPVN